MRAPKAFGIGTLLIVLFSLSTRLTPVAQEEQPVYFASAGIVRRINVWPAIGAQVDDNTASIFWFGRATRNDNYVDVRVGYTQEYLRIFVTVVDYYLWERTSPDKDPRLYDAVAIYFDTAGDRASTPQPDDYVFANGWRSWPNGNAPEYHRDSRGTGSGWDENWSADWTETVGVNWYNSGPNSNGSCFNPRDYTQDCDAGWATAITIPFAALGLAGPPASGTVWGLGVYLYDRDDGEPAPLVSPPAHWPEYFLASNPATWGTLVFDPSPYRPRSATSEGVTTVRRDLSGQVADAYVGGGGNCEGGYLGGADQNYGDEGLFVANQSLVADFPCWSKSYLRFSLSSIPPGKVILSATLTLHLWGNAGPVPSLSYPSLIQLFTVAETWDEHTITWNNAPMAVQNLTATWVFPRTDGGPDFPGIAYHWDATQAVAEAYAYGQPLNVVLYTADTHFDSSKYFVSSDAASDWLPAAKPTLRVTWGRPVPAAEKRASRGSARLGDVVTYSIYLLGAGTTLHVRDPIPPEVAFVPGSEQGGIHWNSAANQMEWVGALAATERTTLAFAVQVNVARPWAVVNTAIVTDGINPALFPSATFIANGYQVYLPVLLRSF